MRLTVTVPIKADPTGDIREGVMYDMATYFGGVTKTFAEGAWVDPDGNMVYDRSHVLESYNTSVPDDEAVEYIWDIAMNTAYRTSEITIMYTVNDNAYFTGE